MQSMDRSLCLSGIGTDEYIKKVDKALEEVGELIDGIFQESDQSES